MATRCISTVYCSTCAWRSQHSTMISVGALVTDEATEDINNTCRRVEALAEGARDRHLVKYPAHRCAIETSSDGGG